MSDQTSVLPMRGSHAVPRRSWAIPQGLSYTILSLVLIAFVLVAPTIYGFIYSLYNIVYMVPTNFIGFGNYIRLFINPDLHTIVIRSVFFTAVAVAMTLVCALAIAIWLDRLNHRLGLLVQILIIIPWIISHVVGALLFRWVFVNDIGFFIYSLDQLGIHNIKPLEDPTVAMALLIGYACWRTLGFAILMFLAGPEEHSEENCSRPPPSTAPRIGRPFATSRCRC